MKSTMSDEMKADAAERGRSYMAVLQFIERIIDGLEVVQDAGDEARAFFASVRDRDFDFSHDRRRSIAETASYWEGFAYGVDVVCGYNAAQIAKTFTEDQINEIARIIETGEGYAPGQ